MALFEIKCPMCKGTIWVDPSSGAVIDHKAADKQKADFDEYLKTRNRPSDWDDKFKKIKSEQDKRKAEIEAKFKIAKEHPEDLKGEVESPFTWD
jgi:hypothetical protein